MINILINDIGLFEQFGQTFLFEYHATQARLILLTIPPFITPSFVAVQLKFNTNLIISGGFPSPRHPPSPPIPPLHLLLARLQNRHGHAQESIRRGPQVTLRHEVFDSIYFSVTKLNSQLQLQYRLKLRLTT